MNNAQDIINFVKSEFGSLGANKQQEIQRLLYEISKRESVPFEDIIKDTPYGRDGFANIKKYLVRRRFSGLSDKETTELYLPALKINPRFKADINKPLRPKNIFVENGIKESPILQRLKERFKGVNVRRIKSLKGFAAGKAFFIGDYNKRRDNFFIIRNNSDFFKKCPCTAGACPCGYEIFNLGFGCIFECTYCYLQQYSNSPGILIPHNIEDYFREFDKSAHRTRLGTGEFADSLALDDITQFSLPLIEFFRKRPGHILELKTKSDNIKNILTAAPCKNIVIAWSLNPQDIIEANEYYTAPLKERLKAASDCAGAGFKVAFHFDPIIHYDNWQKDYEALVNELFDKIPAASIAWISLGTFRFSRALKKVIENRFPDARILEAELVAGFDSKLRYSAKLRIDIYKKMISWIRKRSRKAFIYLCMEDKAIWQQCNIEPFKDDMWLKLI